MATVVPKTEVRHYQMYIDGRWTDAAGGETYDVVDPASEEVIARVPKGGVADAERAVRAARDAFDNGPWPKMKAMERAEILTRAAALLRERAEEFARLESMQMGKLLEESRVDMLDAAHTFELYAGMVQDQHGETLEVPGETMSMVVREPVGVTVGITPWNYPMLMAAWKAGPSLAAGNVMILKPATVSPLTNLELARVFEEAGLPKGVFQVVTGPGGEVGDYLAGHHGRRHGGLHRLGRRRQEHHAQGRREREEDRPGARRQEPEHRVRRRRLRGGHRRRSHRDLRRHAARSARPARGCSSSAPSTTASSASSSAARWRSGSATRSTPRARWARW